ncbi:MAG: arginine decarboxylase, pyruvoyl-dependent [Candidatus Aenigmarchaeota archaeon]|nr:arginine decarboxylase, pyruvoyl-dependent [Candidatus Aenigmarchaeota archaeon]
MVPKEIFFTKGKGIHKDKLVSFEFALQDAGIEKYNLVYVSSIFPPGCKIISKEEGIEKLKPGQIVFCVMSRNQTNEPDKLISASIGVAIPRNDSSHGYIAEYGGLGRREEETGKYAEELARTMLISTSARDMKEKDIVLETLIIAQSSTGKNNFWTTVIAVVVFCE